MKVPFILTRFYIKYDRYVFLKLSIKRKWNKVLNLEFGSQKLIKHFENT